MSTTTGQADSRPGRGADGQQSGRGDGRAIGGPEMDRLRAIVAGRECSACATQRREAPGEVDESSAKFWRRAVHGLPGRTQGDVDRQAATLDRLQATTDLLASLKLGSAVEMYLDSAGLAFTLKLLALSEGEAARCLRLWMAFLAGELDEVNTLTYAECKVGVRDPHTGKLDPAFGGEA